MKEGEEKRRTSNVERRTSKDEERNEGRVWDLEERLLNYSVRIIRLADSLVSTRAGNHVAGQLLRSGTSPLPNHGEAESAESVADFGHKLRICLKELRESRRWLRLIHRVPLVEKPAKVESLIGETEELIRIFVASIRTVQSRSSSSQIREDAPDTPSASLPSTFDVRRSAFDVFLPPPEEAP
jgi:four helix bundle protein